MKYKPVYFFSDADDCYVAMYPELPGCMADGKTVHEALSNLEDSLSDWMSVYHEKSEQDPLSISDLVELRTNPNSKDVASYILNKTGKISTYALQKILYYCQAWSYGWSGKPLFDGEFQAWIDGPVNPTVFQLCRGRRFVSKNDISTTDHVFSDYEKMLMDLILSVYDEFDGDELSSITHQETPWKKGRKGKQPQEHGDTIIPPEDLVLYYGEHL